jgi:hypothetical protein
MTKQNAQPTGIIILLFQGKLILEQEKCMIQLAQLDLQMINHLLYAND